MIYVWYEDEGFEESEFDEPYSDSVDVSDHPVGCWCHGCKPEDNPGLLYELESEAAALDRLAM